MPESAPSFASSAPASARVENASRTPSPDSEPGGAAALSARSLNESELDATFQLLVERAQYITGATGAALALPRGNDMVCRASAGSCAPKVGACLQVRSGLTGESILRRQLLRCDNADTDPRVNLEACRALGIASIVVLPLLRPNGDVRGLFELFADHPYAFEERDLIALERMAALTVTALDLAERNEPIPSGLAGKEGYPLVNADANAEVDGLIAEEHTSALPAPAAESGLASPEKLEPAVTAQSVTAQSKSAVFATASPAGPGISTVSRASTEAQQTGVAAAVIMAPAEVPVATTPDEKICVSQPVAASLPEVPRVEKCSGCGFPVSGGRTLCLDCERKREAEKEELAPSGAMTGQSGEAQGANAELVPAFLANAKPMKQSWFADHVNLLAIAVLVLGIAVCIVVFR